MSTSAPSAPPGGGAGPGRAAAQPGELLAGKYRIERLLGQGGMGVVVAAWHTELEQRVAIKYLHEAALMDRTLVERFDREARAAVKIKGRHVARVSDVGKLANGSPYMVMEFLEGRDVQKLLSDEGAQPIGRAVDIVLEACEAIAEAHACGIVHRDLKPANLFLAEQADGSVEVKVLVLVISKNLSAGADPAASVAGALTTATAVLGSPMYMSPEQLTSTAKVDTRTDIWSLGIILYELLVGTAPFYTGSLAEVWSAILGSPVPSPATRRDGLPEALVDAVMKALTRSIEQRIHTVADFAVAIGPFGTGEASRSIERAKRFGRGPVRTASSPSMPVIAPTTSALAETASAPPPPLAKGKLSLAESGPRTRSDAPPAEARSGNRSSRPSAPSGLSKTGSLELEPPPRSRGTGWLVAIGVIVGIGAPAWFFRRDIVAFVTPASSTAEASARVEEAPAAVESAPRAATSSTPQVTLATAAPTVFATASASASARAATSVTPPTARATASKPAVAVTGTHPNGPASPHAETAAAPPIPTPPPAPTPDIMPDPN